MIPKLQKVDPSGGASRSEGVSTPRLPRSRIHHSDDEYDDPVPESKEERKVAIAPTLPPHLPPMILRPSFRWSDRSKLLHEGSAMVSVLSRSASQSVRLTMGTALTLSTNVSGFVNAVAATSLVAGLTEFSNLATVYSEFFIHKFEVMYMPQSRYNGPVAFSTATGASSLPMGVLAIHHAQTPPTTLAAAADNSTIVFVNTCDPFKFSWKNIESAKTRTLISPVPGTAVPVQSWCLTAGAASSAYTGQIQFISNTSVGCPANTVVGELLCRFDVSFRTKV
jgi:hypothetical protein